MEPLGSTYSGPLLSEAAAGEAARSSQSLRSSAGPEAESAGLKAFPAGRAPEQKGFQPSEPSVDEFKPYSRSGVRKSGEAGAGKINTDKAEAAAAAGGGQDPRIEAQIAQLKATEEKVKAHEAAHKSAGGPVTGPVSYTYTRGPDGRNYITGGEVPIAVSSGRTPQETINRMQQVIQAALAPADPSPQDRAVAAQASTQEQQARQELASSASVQQVSYYA